MSDHLIAMTDHMHGDVKRTAFFSVVLQVWHHQKWEDDFKDLSKAEYGTNAMLTKEERQNIQYCLFYGSAIFSKEILHFENYSRRIHQSSVINFGFYFQTFYNTYIRGNI